MKVHSRGLSRRQYVYIVISQPGRNLPLEVCHSNPHADCTSSLSMQCKGQCAVGWVTCKPAYGQRPSVNLHSLRSPWRLHYLFSSVGAAGEWFGHSQIICDIKRWVLTPLGRLLTANIKTHNSVLWKHVQCEHKSDPHQWQIWPIISIHLIQTSVLNINPKAPQVLRAELGAFSFQSSWWVPF